MIHKIWILSVLYRISTYFLFFENYYHYNIYAIILISLHRNAGTSRCPLFIILNTFFVCKTGKIAIIHGCRLIISHTPPTIQANVESLWSTYTKICQFPCSQNCETRNLFAQNMPKTIDWLESQSTWVNWLEPQSTRVPDVCPSTDSETIWIKSYSTRVPGVCPSTNANTIRLES